MIPVNARGLAEGEATGPVLITPPISFLGDLDIVSGTIVGDLPGVRGLSVRGVVLVTPSTRGSAGAWRFLYQLHKFGQSPAAIVSEALPDPSLVQGAILAGLPVVWMPDRPIAEFAEPGAILRVVSRDGRAVISRAA